MSLNFVNNVANRFGQNQIQSRVRIVLFFSIKNAFPQYREGAMGPVVLILWKSAQKKVFTRKNIDAKIAAVESLWIPTNQEAFPSKQGKPINRVNFENFATNENHKKCLAVFKLDYVIILVIITVLFAIGMTFAQSLDWLFKTGIFLRKESVEVRDLQSTVHRFSMDRSWSISWSAKSSFRQLNALYKKMLINIEEQNPQLFSFVEELQQIKKLRQGKVNFWEVNFGHFSSWGLKVYGSKSKTNQPRYKSQQIYRCKNCWGS